MMILRNSSWCLAFITAFTCCQANAKTTQPTLLAKLDYGTFQGAFSEEYNLSYWGKIPFAAPPIGQNRFRAPQPPLKESGIYDSNTTFSACPEKTGDGEEDCLYLGLWSRPWEEGQPLKPVTVWFYGGAFIQGYGFVTFPPVLYPTLNVSEAGDAIYVFPNYRVNAFGFLPGKEIAEDPSSDLNAGLLDQQAVLEWVQKNIAKFGGDPKNVSIWGQSAGGGSVVAQVIANGGNSPHLFSKALASSPFWPKTYNYDAPDAQKLYDELVDLTGCSNATRTLACLKAVDVDTLRLAAYNISYSQTYTTSSYTWAPVIDGSFLKEPLTKASARGAVNIDYGWGMYNTHEGENFVPSGLQYENSTGTPPFNSSTASFMNWVSGFLPDFTEDDVNRLLSIYPAVGQTETLSWNTSYTRAGVIYRDVVLACPAYWTAKAAHKESYVGEYTISPAKHASDTSWWYTVDGFQTNSTFIYDGFVGAFASFLHSGDPNADKLTNSSVVGVPSFKRTGEEFVIESSGFENLKIDKLQKRCGFWESVASRVPI